MVSPMLLWRVSVFIGKPVYKVLEPSSLSVWIANARHIKYVPGHKTDKADSAWICKLLQGRFLLGTAIYPIAKNPIMKLTSTAKRQRL